MKVKIKLKNGTRKKYDDVKMIKELSNNNEIVIANKEVCAFQFMDNKPRLQIVKTCINKYEIKNIKISEL